MRIPIIAGNWKMNKTVSEATSLVESLKGLLAEVKDRVIIICPPFTALYAVKAVIKDTDILLGAQNVFGEERGAYTGEVSPLMLKELGCSYVIIGHSERRKYFGETDEGINLKMKLSLAHNLMPIVCVGERLEERERGETSKVVTRQVKAAFRELDSAIIKEVVIAYEPVWAIGTGMNALGEDANSVIGLIRDIIKEKYGQEVGQAIRILYGGSVKPENIEEFMQEEEIDGALVGGESLKAESFARIVKFGME